MGCKCGRDLLFGDNEIIKAESIRAHYNKKNDKNPYNNNKDNNKDNNDSIPLNNNTLNLMQYNNINNIQNPEMNFAQKNDESSAILNMYGSQRSSLDMNLQKEITTEKNEYPQKVTFLINKIRSNPLMYANVVEESIKNIKVTKNHKIIYSNEVKVALHRGEEAFREAINQLKQTEPMMPLRFNPQLCIPLPENEVELNEKNYLKEAVDKMRGRNTNIEIYYKDLIKIPEVSVLLMIVDDNSKNVAKKRDTLLNKDFKFIGCNCKYIGKNFVAHFSFSR
jgi:hypothetical protein